MDAKEKFKGIKLIFYYFTPESEENQPIIQ